MSAGTGKDMDLKNGRVPRVVIYYGPFGGPLLVSPKTGKLFDISAQSHSIVIGICQRSCGTKGCWKGARGVSGLAVKGAWSPKFTPSRLPGLSISKSPPRPDRPCMLSWRFVVNPFAPESGWPGVKFRGSLGMLAAG